MGDSGGADKTYEKLLRLKITKAKINKILRLFILKIVIGLTRLPKFEAKSRLETRRTDVRRVSNADFNEEIGQTLVA